MSDAIEPLIGLGHDLALGALVPFVVEPQCPEGMVNAQRDFASDRSLYEIGLHGICLWPVIDGREYLHALLTQMGIHFSGQLRQAVTVYLPAWDHSYHRWNAYANRPRTINYAFFPTNLRVVFDSAILIE